MRVKFKDHQNNEFYGEFLGLVTGTEHDDGAAIVRLDGHEMYVRIIHPSKLVPVQGTSGEK